MSSEETGFRVKRCVVCGKEFEVRNSRDAKREYCDYNSPCRRRWNLMRERERAERERAEASAAQARTADQLAHAEAKLLLVREEYARADEARRREHETLARFVGQVRLMLRKRIMVLDPSSPHWPEREDYAWAMGVIADWEPDVAVPADRAELDRRLAQADEDYRQAIAEGDVDTAGAVERRRRRDMDEWWRTHPEQWAQYNISVISQAYREDHDGEEMPFDAAELEWYRAEAGRRRAALDAADGTNISGEGREHMKQ